MNLFQQVDTLSPEVVPPRVKLRRLLPLLFLLGVTGCQLLQKPSVPIVEEGSPPVSWYYEAACEKLLKEKTVLQREIERLRKQVAEKEVHIRTQEARHQDQIRTLQETSTQATHAQVKLRRLATRPAAASTIAEVEVLMRNLKPSSETGTEAILQTQAARLLDAATASYARGDFGGAMDYAAQAREFLGMITSNRARRASDPLPASVSFHVPIPLRAITASNLRGKPGLNAPVLGTLKKGSTMIADAYRGEWLQILTSDGRSGWVLNELVEAQITHPRRNTIVID